jgi:hypothetical protein
MSDDLVIQIRQALEECAERIGHYPNCDSHNFRPCDCDRSERVQADAACAIAAALHAGMWCQSTHGHGYDEAKFVAALRQEAP